MSGDATAAEMVPVRPAPWPPGGAALKSSDSWHGGMLDLTLGWDEQPQVSGCWLAKFTPTLANEVLTADQTNSKDSSVSYEGPSIGNPDLTLVSLFHTHQATYTSIIVPGQLDPAITHAIELSTTMMKESASAEGFKAAVGTLVSTLNNHTDMKPSDYEQLNIKYLSPIAKRKKEELGDKYDGTCTRAMTDLFHLILKIQSTSDRRNMSKNERAV